MEVSIHTRHYWRVKQLALGMVADQFKVSIHTRHYWRVKRAFDLDGLLSRMFQSTPAITGG